ncbi:FimV/HubP family polar landmark protein [Methylotenera sp.]|uniref:FimV/HubP family polar landmark protein n=1 Tax=Methylotenera sp. TaxID=2051956 RepID=UPI00273112D4|nr:FimV/HubP family polar landmark protein [Methylotenera sp.]MDP2071749.1 FimV/HubP family polar landmark protein [Methylotenera sp.]MDP3006388.1 FimV/HubP family polar landmark protein [Methylotenera sp.]
MRKSKLKQISLAVCLALMPLSIYAAGLGKLNVSSGIGEPLRAEIELLSVTPEELSTLAASIGSEDAYAQQGIPRLGIHNNIKIELAKNANGSPILKLHSNQPVNDPYLDMLVQVDWASGRLQREYTVLLDPPGYKPSEPSLAMPITQPALNNSSIINKSKGVSQSSDLTTGSIDTAPPVAKRTKKFKKATVQPPVEQDVVSNSTASVEQELTTKRGDTLSSIARATQVEGVSLDQMLAGLYENNKDAFSSGNMNRLKVGQIIKVPSKEVLTAIDSQQAKKEIKVHSVNWNAYRNALAGNVAAQPAVAESEEKQSASGKIATAEDKAAPAKAGPQDVVKLSAGDKVGGKSANDTAKSVEAKMLALQEETTAREKSLKEAMDRTAALEKQIEDMQKLIALKSQSMSELQKNAETAAKVPETKLEATEEHKVEETPKAEVATPVEEKQAEVTKSVPAPAVQPQATTQEEPSFFAGLMDSVNLALLGGVAGVTLLGAGWMFLRNKRRKDLDSFERGILTSGGLRANTVFGNTTGNASMSDTSFLTDFAQSADGSMIDTNDVDPIAEAEVYMAYGRDAQAEEILKDAISKEPKRYELHLKLLEMYAARKDTSAFEAIAGELYTTLGADDPTWEKVAAIGAEMEPGNPLYNVSKSAALVTGKPEDIAATPEDATAKDNALDFSFNNDDVITASQPVSEDANSVVLQSFAAAEDVGQDLSFDLGLLDDGAKVVVGYEGAETTQSVEKDLSDNSMDFDLGDFKSENILMSAATESVSDELPLNADDISALQEITDTPSTDFDMDFNLPDETVASQLASQKETSANMIEDISFDLDFANDAVTSTPDAQVAMDATEISFDLPHIEEPVTSVAETSSKPDALEANTFDLSSIDLDLADTEPELPVEKSAAKTVSPAVDNSESQDVNIKLDLVAAYIDMDDKEGARELLEEVLKEGGIQQQVRAQQLLDSLA